MGLSLRTPTYDDYRELTVFGHVTVKFLSQTLAIKHLFSFFVSLGLLLVLNSIIIFRKIPLMVKMFFVHTYFCSVHFVAIHHYAMKPIVLTQYFAI